MAESALLRAGVIDSGTLFAVMASVACWEGGQAPLPALSRAFQAWALRLQAATEASGLRWRVWQFGHRRQRRQLVRTLIRLHLYQRWRLSPVLPTLATRFRRHRLRSALALMLLHGWERQLRSEAHEHHRTQALRSSFSRTRCNAASRWLQQRRRASMAWVQAALYFRAFALQVTSRARSKRTIRWARERAMSIALLAAFRTIRRSQLLAATRSSIQFRLSDGSW